MPETREPDTRDPNTRDQVTPDTPPAAGPRPAPLPAWAVPAGLVLLVVLFVWVVVRLAPPAPRPEGAPPGVFSAGRALTVLKDLAGDGSPRPVGSPAHERTRGRVIAAFERLGYRPRVEEGFACRPFGTCAQVQNVVAELPGSERSAVLLMAHYDSVAGGPGIGDDLAGVAAVLEVARALKADPAPRSSVIFLIDDGEEAGLLGAETFAASSPDAAWVRAVVNLEARGTSGPSLMFETGRRNRWLMPTLARLPRPVTSSLFPAIYDILPNDTDFSVFKRQGLSGLNFAFIGGAARYHTALDNLAHLSPASLQHHGDNALAAVRSLAAADLARFGVPASEEAPSKARRAVFFDLLGYRLIAWPAAWSLPLALAGLLLVVLAAFRLLRSGRAKAAGVLAGLGGWLAVVLAAGLLGYGFNLLFRLLGGLAPSWPMRGVPAQATFWFLALTLVAFGAMALRQRSVLALWAGVWLGWALAALAVALLLPGASYLFVVPVLVAGLVGLVLGGGGSGPRAGVVRVAALLLPAAAAAALWFPLLLLLYDGLGAPILWLIGTLAAILFATVLPLLAGATPLWRVGTAIAAVFLLVVMAVGIVASPRFSKDVPQRINVVYHLDRSLPGNGGGQGQGRWLVTTGKLPIEMRREAKFERRPKPAFPWATGGGPPSYVAPASALPLAPPAVAVLADQRTAEGRQLRLRLTSPRGARVATLYLPREAGLTAARVGGREIPRQPDGSVAGRGDWHGLTVLTLPPEGIEIELVLRGDGPLELTLLDRTPGVPPVGADLLAARPATAAPTQDGDGTVVTRRISL